MKKDTFEFYEQCNIIASPSVGKINPGEGLWLYKGQGENRFELHDFNKGLYKEIPTHCHIHITKKSDIKDNDLIYDLLIKDVRRMGYSTSSKLSEKVIGSTDSSLSTNRLSREFIEYYCKHKGLSKVLVRHNDNGPLLEDTCLKIKPLEKLDLNANWTSEEVKTFGLWLGEVFKKQNLCIPIKKSKTIDELFSEWSDL